ncbi:hypothetical protein Vafri_19559 [Volvox africanus]|uniref:Uncharacterized protein n=2 Tax=Volvox africanus TaxID=51714 RepID=A0A8J4BPU4_9CHLO|nr:hypothetical protein Vafri_19559 [Volvox africanus]
MASLPDSSIGGEDYDYPDDFTDLSEDHDLSLPGLHAPPSALPWPGGDDWCLPGRVQQSETSSNSGSCSDNENGAVESPVRLAPQGARSPTEATAASELYQREPWMVQLDAGAASPSASGSSGIMQARFVGSAGISCGMLPLRNVSITSGRSLFGPFGSSSLQHRDALQSIQPHPLGLTVQQQQQFLPSPSQRLPPTPVQPLPQLPAGDQDRNREQDLLLAVGSGLEDDEDEDGQGDRPRAGGDPWSFLDADPFLLAASSTCSSSLSTSRDPSPQPQPAAAQSFAVPLTGLNNGPQLWYGNPYADSQIEHGFALALEPRLRRRSSNVGGTGGLTSQEGDGRSRGLARGLGSFGLGPEQGPAADNTHGSGGSSDSSHSSWAGRPGLDGRYEEGGPSTSQPTAAAIVLWPMGPPGELLGSGGPSRTAGMAAVGEVDWPMDSSDARHRHAVRTRASELSATWRPSQEDEGMDELGASMAGTGSSALRSMGEPSWGHQYGGPLGDRSSPGLSFGDSSGPIHRYSPRSTLGDSDLSGIGPSPSGLTSAGPRGATPGGNGGYRASGFGGGSSSGLNGGGGATLCFTSLDSPSGPYDRRRIVLTSAHRRNTEASTPSVRQYSDGLAGMLTNAQIQEWMSQHASRLLLPRHMQEIADIVFRPPSAVPEKKPLKCPSSGVATLPPPVVLGGRYPPLHVSRLASDTAFMADLLVGLSGVNFANSRVQAVITALQGKDLVVTEEGEEGGAQRAGRTVLTKSLRPPSRIQPK